MKLADLKSPKKTAVCVACQAFNAEVRAPVGEGSAPMCWLCAHHVVDHGVALHDAMEARCECTPDQVYPARVLQQRALQIIGNRTHDGVPSARRGRC